MRIALAAVLLAAVALAATAPDTAVLADPAPAPTDRASLAAPDLISTDPVTSPAGPVELGDGQMDRVRAGGVRVASSPTTRESTLD